MILKAKERGNAHAVWSRTDSETMRAWQRDRNEKDGLIQRQLDERG